MLEAETDEKETGAETESPSAESLTDYVEGIERRRAKSEVRKTGAIRKLKVDRGFGFIAGDDGVDYFFHWTGMEKSTKDFRDLEIYDRVSFTTVAQPQGPRAIQIRVEVTRK